MQARRGHGNSTGEGGGARGCYRRVEVGITLKPSFELVIWKYVFQKYFAVINDSSLSLSLSLSRDKNSSTSTAYSEDEKNSKRTIHTRPNPPHIAETTVSPNHTTPHLHRGDAGVAQPLPQLGHLGYPVGGVVARSDRADLTKTKIPERGQGRLHRFSRSCTRETDRYDKDKTSTHTRSARSTNTYVHTCARTAVQMARGCD